MADLAGNIPDFSGMDFSGLSIPTNAPAPKPEQPPAPSIFEPAQATQGQALVTPQTQSNNTTIVQGQSSIGVGDNNCKNKANILGQSIGGTTMSEGTLKPEDVDRKRKI